MYSDIHVRDESEATTNVNMIDKMGRSLNTAKNDYDTMVSTRRKQLEKPLNKIDEITSLTESSNVDRLDGGQQKL